MNFTRAIVRPPGRNFADGLTSAGDGAPDFALAVQQHRQYCAALSRCGLALTHLEPDSRYPDGTFVEDAAIVTARGAILTRPGAATRAGEVESVGGALRAFFATPMLIGAPGTVDGGDVCEADGHFFIGLSARTNEAGARQLQTHLAAIGYSASLLDIRASRTLLHLKTGIAYLGDGTWVLAAAIAGELQSAGLTSMRDVIRVPPQEAYAANCVRVNECVLLPAGYPVIAAALASRGLNPLPLPMSEFKKMDGGLSCLSLRF